MIINKEQAYWLAKRIADEQAAPCLIMYDGKNYKAGLRTDKSVRLFGRHVATAKRYGVIVEDDCIRNLPDPDRRCLCE